MNYPFKDWASLPDENLIDLICSDIRNFYFKYREINEINLKQKVGQLLLKIASEPLREDRNNCSSWALLLCSQLQLSGTDEIILKMINIDPITFINQDYINWLNMAIYNKQLPEGLGFLLKEFNLLESKPDFKPLWIHSALTALRAYNPDLAGIYNRKLNISSPYMKLEDWAKMNEGELLNEIKKSILGFGMAGSTSHFGFIPEIYDHIENTEFKERVDKILLTLIDYVEGGVGERAIYMFTFTFKWNRK